MVGMQGGLVHSQGEPSSCVLNSPMDPLEEFPEHLDRTHVGRMEQ